MTDEEMNAMLGSIAKTGDIAKVPEVTRAEVLKNIGILIPIGAGEGKQDQSNEFETEESLNSNIRDAITAMHECLGDRLESNLGLSDNYWKFRDRVHILQGRLKTLLDIGGNPFPKG